MYQVKITKEGLVNAFKVSKEILTSMTLRLGKKFLAISVPSILTQVRSTVMDSPNTWRTDSSSLLSGLNGDKFYCEGANGYSEPQYFIKVGCVHRLPSWDMVEHQR